MRLSRTMAALAALSVIAVASAYLLRYDEVAVTLTWWTMGLMLATLGLVIGQSYVLSAMFDQTFHLQARMLDRFGYTGTTTDDDSSGSAGPVCQQCGTPTIGYDGRFIVDLAGHRALVETNSPCGCEVGRVRLVQKPPADRR